MRSIRKGNTFVVRWSIVDQLGDPYNLEGLDLSLYLSATVWQMKVEDFTVEDNVIEFTFQGADQVFVGVYSLILYVNQESVGQQVVDTKEAFRLVGSSDETVYGEDDQIEIEVVELVGTTDANGYSPTAAVERAESGAIITIRDKNGTTTAEVYDGEQGVQGDPGVGFESVSSAQDGTVVITLTTGDSITIDLNHDHPAKPNYVYCASEAAYEAITVKEDNTIYLILGQ